MTSKFDSLYEQLLSEAPMGIEGSVEDLASEITKKAEASPMSGHWKGIKRLPDMSNAVLDILKIVLPDKHPKTGKENTYSTTIDDKKDLKNAIYSAVQKVTQKKGYAETFAGDRVNTMVLAKAAFDVAQNVQSTGNPPTQKQAKQALNKRLQAKPAAEMESITVYFKSADAPDDSELAKAFNKLPENKDMTKQQVMEIVKDEEAVNGLIRSGALISKEAEPEEPEQEEGEGTGEVTTGVDVNDVSDFDTFDDVYNALGDDTSKRVGGYFND